MDEYEIRLTSEDVEDDILLDLVDNGESLQLQSEEYTPVGVTSVNGKKGKVVLATSDLTNNSDYQNGKQVNKTVDDKIEAHNTSPSAHAFIREQVNKLSTDVVNKQDRLVSGQNIKSINNESILGSGNLDIQGVDNYNLLTNKPQITYTSTTVNDRTVTQTSITETIDGTKSIGSYGPFNFIPLDMSEYTSGTSSRALLPETHLPYGVYIVTEPGWMRLGNETKDLEKGTLIYWYDSGELDLMGYNACEYWAYDSQNDEWSGGYFTTEDDVSIIADEIANWRIISSTIASGTLPMKAGFWYRRYRATGVTKLTFNFPDTVEHNYKCRVTCKTASTFTKFVVTPESYDIYLYGDDCSNGVLTGVANKYYDIQFEGDGFGGVIGEVHSHTL